jgi:hypothetical protein
MLSRLARQFAQFAAVLFLLANLPHAARAEDPARFQSVTNWYATFNRTLRSAGAGEGPSCRAEWSFSHSFEIKTELKVLPFFGWTDIGKTNQSVYFQLHDTGTQTCGESEPTVYTAGDAKNQLLQAATLTISTNATNYSLGLGYFVTYDGKVNGDPFPTSAIAWTIQSKGPIVEPLPETGMILKGRRSYSVNESTMLDGIMTIALSALSDSPNLLNGELVIEWTLTPVIEEVELVVDGPDYEDWLPKGDVKDWNKRGDILFLTASLQTTNGGVPIVTRAKNIKFELLNVSKEKGVCLNRPHQEFADDKPDLKFESVVNQPPLMAIPLQVGDGGKTATTADGEHLLATAGISSFDFGAYGEIKVTATVNGTNVVGYYKKDSAKEQKPLLIPKRKPNSFIADKWKKDNNAENLSDDDDDDNEPVGDTHKGDGFTLYEEYRGFSENLNHIRLKPKQKDFFIIDWIKADDSAAGISAFAGQTGLNVHSEMRAEEFHADIGANGELFDTWVNFNRTTGPHKVNQHGIGIIPLRQRGAGSYSGTDPSKPGLNRGEGGSPGRYRTISIDPIQRGWPSVTNPDGSLGAIPRGPAVIAHELSHTCTVWHHGDLDPEHGVEWKRNGADILEFGAAIEVRDEDNTASALLFPTNNIVKKYIGVLHGEHSGAEDCFMRYYISQAYRSTTNTQIRYLPDADEITGLAMCTSASGTGVNLSTHRPQARYGDASAGRGNCKGQVCVNDAYEGQHDR